MTTKMTLLACLIALGACGGDDGGLTGDDQQPMPDAPPATSSIVEVPAGDISVDTTWEARYTYVLKGYVFFTGGTLTIEAGTLIKGDNGSALTITRNAKINAVGTADKPIVFTSSQATPKGGDWGGVVLLGRSTINVTAGAMNPAGENYIEGFAARDDHTIYGGGANPVADHDCGKLKYARIEYAGFQLAPNNELNGLTIGGCGSRTEIDYIQSHLGQDDGIEIFGGSVNVSHLVITQPDDDGLDWDLGWTGRAQFVIVQQKAGRGDKGFEADNDAMGTDNLPRSAPEIWNATVIGGDGPPSDKKQGGMHLRRATGGRINNAIVAYWNQFAVDVDSTKSAGLYGGALVVKNTYFVKSTNAAAVWPAGFDVGGNPPVENDGGFDEQAMIGGDATNHLDVDVQLGDAKNVTAPSFKPLAGSPVLTGCGTPPAGFDQSATFCGAVGTVDWTTGWTLYPN